MSCTSPLTVASTTVPLYMSCCMNTWEHIHTQQWCQWLWHSSRPISHCHVRIWKEKESTLFTVAHSLFFYWEFSFISCFKKTENACKHTTRQPEMSAGRSSEISFLVVWKNYSRTLLHTEESPLSKANWPTSYVNLLPISCFIFVTPHYCPKILLQEKCLPWGVLLTSAQRKPKFSEVCKNKKSPLQESNNRINGPW